MRKTRLLPVPVLLGALLLNGCSWGIHLDDSAKNVRTAWSGDVSSCHNLGRVTVSVMDHVGPVDRNTITVRDELEVMARNEAASMHADTIKPLAEPSNGSQPWGAYRCGAQYRPSSQRPAPNDQPPPDGGAQTFPLKGG
jgi:hypothetical protein